MPSLPLVLVLLVIVGIALYGVVQMRAHHKIQQSKPAAEMTAEELDAAVERTFGPEPEPEGE